MNEQNEIDMFESMVKDIQFDTDDVVDVTKLSIESLMDNLVDLQTQLLDSGEALHPSTQESRDMHSLRNSIQIELRKRGK